MQTVNLVGRVLKKADLKTTNAGQLITLTVEDREEFKGQSGPEVKVQAWPITFWKDKAVEVSTKVQEGDLVEVSIRFSRYTGENENGDMVTKTNITGANIKVHHSAIKLPPLGPAPTNNAAFGGTNFEQSSGGELPF